MEQNSYLFYREVLEVFYFKFFESLHPLKRYQRLCKMNVDANTLTYKKRVSH